MFDPTELTPKELVFLAELMDQGSDNIPRQVCKDMSDLAYDLFDPDEKDQLERRTVRASQARLRTAQECRCG